jgi:predicted nucleic acid-binding Zn ribbon protein
VKKKRARLLHPMTLDTVLRKHGDQRFSKVLLPIPHGVWRTIVGTQVSLRAFPVALRAKVLTVQVATSGWAQELSLHSPMLISRLAEEGFEIESIRFRVGDVAQHERPKERTVVTRVPMPAAIPPSIAKALRETPDEELRELIAESVGASLALHKE